MQRPHIGHGVGAAGFCIVRAVFDRGREAGVPFRQAGVPGRVHLACASPACNHLWLSSSRCEPGCGPSCGSQHERRAEGRGLQLCPGPEEFCTHCSLSIPVNNLSRRQLRSIWSHLPIVQVRNLSSLQRRRRQLNQHALFSVVGSHLHFPVCWSAPIPLSPGNPRKQGDRAEDFSRQQNDVVLGGGGHPVSDRWLSQHRQREF